MRQTIMIRLPLKGSMLSWDTFEGDPIDTIRGIGLEEFRDFWEAANALPDGSWPASIPADETGIKIILAWIDYVNGVAEYDVTAHSIIIAGLRAGFNGKTPDEIASDHPTVARLQKPVDLTLPARGKFGGSRPAPDDDKIQAPNVLS